MKKNVFLICFILLIGCKSNTKSCIQKIGDKEIVINYTDFQNLFKKLGYTNFEAGNLMVANEKVVIVDPVISVNSVALDKKVPKGKYPIFLFFTDADLGYKIAFSMIRFKDEVPTKWELALPDANLGANSTSKLGKVISGAGILGFGSVESNALFLNQKDEFEKMYPNRNFYQDVLALEFNKNGGNPNGSISGGDWVNFFPQQQQNLNIIFSSTGIGNGTYTAYWGLNDAGEPLQLVLDFKLFENEDEILEIYNILR